VTCVSFFCPVMTKRFFLCLVTWMPLIACAPGAPSRAADYSKVPIVFVHGSGLAAASWQTMRDALIRQGYPPEYLEAVDIPPGESANDLAARRSVAPAISKVLDRAAYFARRDSRSQPTKVDLVGHSMGAFSSRYYVSLQPETVRVWLGIAGANYGTNALCKSTGAGDVQMCPAFASSEAQSAVQAALNGTAQEPRDPTPFGLGLDAAATVRVRPDATRCIAYLTIRIEPDEWITPASSAMLAGAGGLTIPMADTAIEATRPGNFLLRSAATHDDLPQHPEVIKFVAAALASADREIDERCRSVVNSSDSYQRAAS
jgi:pimeloyl-ACP methyl ester carboxylesterase